MNDWMVHGSCRGIDNPDIFFPDSWSTAGMSAAKRVCRPCPVRRPCLEWQLARTASASADFGVWGGTGPAERDRIRKWRQARAAA